MDARSSAVPEVSAQAVRREKRGDIGFLVIDNPPVNASSVEVRRGLLDGIHVFGADPTLRGIVIIGDGNTFVAGSDIREFDAPIQSPSLPEVILAIEDAPVPVVAAIHGNALGGGFELALGCDGRIAVSGSMVGLPEVSLGMIPGAGGTQRVAYLTGKAKAIEIVTSSRRLTAAEALKVGLIDQVVEDDFADAAAKFAESLDGKKPRIRDRAVPVQPMRKLRLQHEPPCDYASNCLIFSRPWTRSTWPMMYRSMKRCRASARSSTCCGRALLHGHSVTCFSQSESAFVRATAAVRTQQTFAAWAWSALAPWASVSPVALPMQVMTLFFSTPTKQLSRR
jgi:enoyl-CoA hydratase/carnithine racemase